MYLYPTENHVYTRDVQRNRRDKGETDEQEEAVPTRPSTYKYSQPGVSNQRRLTTITFVSLHMSNYIIICLYAPMGIK
jgi:hypothetical protein